MLCTAPVLKVFDSRLPTRVVCDASNFCVGGVLEQQSEATGKWHPVEYYSKRLSSSERNYSATDREYVAIRQCLERWRHFLVGCKFLILTDHVALTYIQKSASVSRRNARWLEFLSQFNFEIEHIRGRENIVADALSRVPGSESLQQLFLCSASHTLGVEHVDEVGDDVAYVDERLFGVISVFENSSFMQQLQAEQEASSNVWFLDKVKQAKGGSTVFVYRNGVLCKLVKDTFCPIIPDCTSSTVNIVLGDLHASALGGHLGYRKLLRQVQGRFYWQNMCKTVEDFLKRCGVCQQNKHSTQRPVGLLNPVENPDKPFAHVTMDFIVQLPRSTRGYDAIFSIIDRFSRVCRFIPCHTSLSALEAAQLFFEHWVCRFGVPQKIVSDRDVKFTSQFWQQLFKLLGCRVALSSAYHPQTDGLTERFHRTIEQTLRCYCSGQQEQWCKLLSQCEFALNSSFQDAVQDTPFRVVHGFNPTIPLDVQLGGVQLPAVSNFVQQRQDVQQRVLGSLAESQARMANTADRHRRHLAWEVGQQAWLSTKHLPVRGTSRKLSALWAGPYRVIGKISEVAFRLQLPTDWHIHDVFHVSQLKPVVGEVQVEQAIEVDGQQEYEIERIVDVRVVRGAKQYLCKWKGYGDFENSWVKAVDMGNARELVAAFERDLSQPRKAKGRRGSGVRQ